MLYLIFLFAFVAIIHYLSLKVQIEKNLYTKFFGKRGFLAHSALTGTSWTLLFLVLALSDKSSFPKLPFFSPVFIPIGFSSIVLGSVIFLWAGFQLGLKRTWGIRFFDTSYKDKLELNGSYKFLESPIYTGLFLYFLGFALFSNSLFYLFLSGESYLLLNIFMAKLENQEFKDSKKRPLGF